MKKDTVDKNFLVDHMKSVLVESKEILPTIQLQLLSLISFMNALGYAPKELHCPKTFILVDVKPGYPLSLNLENACHLHNQGFFIHTFDEFYQIPKGFRLYSAKSLEILWDASNHKLVEDVYLQWSKKRKEFCVTTHIVKFNKEKDWSDCNEQR